MKHNLKITIILLCMFLIAQLIGLAVINAYSPKTKLQFNEETGKIEQVIIKPQLPYGMQPPEMKPVMSITTIIIAMMIAIFLIFLLMKIKATIFLKLWFFFVVIIALAITFTSLFLNSDLYTKVIALGNIPLLRISSLIALVIAVPLAFYKIFKRNLIVHNFTELLIYPGIAAVFVPILSLWTIVLLLLLISVYDIYAVWHSGFMQKMAKFQMNQLKIFAGFFVPYLSKKQREKVKLMKQKKSKKDKRIRISLAILGGGDVVFPIIMAGVVFRTLGLFPALLISLFATLALSYLFIISEKGKFYPAMPFITAGCLVGLVISYLFLAF